MSLESFEQAPKKAILPELETQAFYGSLKSAWVVLEKVRSLSDREKAQHDPEEIERIDPFNNNIPYDWNLKHR